MTRFKRLFCFSFISFFLASSTGCEKNLRSYEEESKDLEQRAYNINFQIVNESSYVSEYAELLSDHTSKRYIPAHRKKGINDFYQRFSFGRTSSSLYIPERLDSMLSKHKRLNLLTTRVVINEASGVYIYPKLEHNFPELEKEDFDYLKKSELHEEINPNGIWIKSPFYHPLDNHRLIGRVEKYNTPEDRFVTAHMSLELLEERFIEHAPGIFVVADPEGEIHAASKKAYLLLGLTKPKPHYMTASRKRAVGNPSHRNVLNSRNEEVRNAMYDVLYNDRKKVKFGSSESDCVVLAADIRELKWKIMRIITLNDKE